ncbi:hypothetical protein QAD02_002596 [Eretmocerus hayati]|uniref:Uncharacterized protein n=1 Tax=Eretmocerus hayati TaxID=131215 RepID=A0ACC2NM81_9HYME|nr:hypothetical protein QAD02_002596 [Eretmocerus hayati]
MYVHESTHRSFTHYSTEQTLPSEERQSELEVNEDTPHSPVFPQKNDLQGNSGINGHSIPDEASKSTLTTTEQLSIQSLHAPQTGGGGGMADGNEDSSHNLQSSNGMSQNPLHSGVLPPGQRFIVASEGHRHVRRFGVIARWLALQVLQPPQSDRNHILYPHYAIGDMGLHH